MKTIIKILILSLSVSLISCSDDFLEPTPTSVLTTENYFNTPEEVETAVINMYDAIQGVNSTRSEDNHGVMYEFYLTEMRSDNTRTKSSEGEAAQFENYSIQPTNGIVNDYYASFYNVIYRANVVLANLEVAGASATKFEAEAKFVRAYAYFNLVRLFGDVPLVETIISPEDKTTAYTRVATSTIYELIENDLLTAINGLSDESKYRASKAAAETLLAKVYLTLSRYSEAQALLESVMNPSRGFSLEPNYKDVFYNEGNNEIIFTIGYLGDSEDSQNFSAEWLNAVGRTSGVNYVTNDAKQALDDLGGNRTAYSYRVDQAQITQHQVVKYLPNGDDNLGILPTSSDPTKAGNDWIVLRYADVILMHVEAIMAGAASTTSSTAINSMQLIRNRAGITTPITSISKQELLDERRVELAFENHRLFDLIRMGEAENTLGTFSANNGLSFSSTDLLLPIPQREINLSNGLLTQNPGY
ncbi:RagB/SusD family nutrient uptake outer membrane protein [Tenacibaculum geojense]|uniref:RagB/SusD family nutrient uptake outer membrane protein n=1 Tax=Tenacibaculum geojense TaxID=915352 RepID=A0ABW3JTE5_9FLAO